MDNYQLACYIINTNDDILPERRQDALDWINTLAAERERLHGLLEEVQYWIEQVNFVDTGALKARIRAALRGEGEEVGK